MATEVESNVPVVADTIKQQEEENKGAAAVAAPEGDNAGSGDAPAATAAAPVAAVKEPPAPKIVVHKANYEKDTVYMYQFSRTPLLPSMSPYCLKVETWLRLAGLKYENVDHKLKFRSKKGQLPFIELNGEEIADSAIIIKELAQRYGHDLDAALTPDQRNIAHATISMLENHLVWVVAWWRTKYPDLVLKGYKVNLQHALNSRLPNGILNLLFKFTFGRKGAKKVKAQGMGVHSADEIHEFGMNDLKVLSDMLADKPFFFGDDPTTLDVVAFAHLAQIYFIDKEVSYPLHDYMAEHCANLVGLVNRMKERCYPDWEDMCANLDLNAHLPKPPPAEEKAKEGEGEGDEKAKEKEKGKEDKEDVDVEKEKADEKEKEKEKDTDENKDKDAK